MASRFHEFLPHCTFTAHHCQISSTKSVPFMSGPAQIEAFATIPKELCKPPALNHFHDSWDVELHTDTRNAGLGAVLLGRDPKGTQHATAFARRNLLDAEKQAHNNELERSATLWGNSKKLHHYFYTSYITVVTDTSAVMWTFKEHNLEQMFSQWIMILLEYH